MILAKILIAIVAALHFYFLYFEMFSWENLGKKIFKSLDPALFTPTKALAANQGLYNGFLGAGLIWSLFVSNLEWQRNIASFFLICVAVAGIYGSLTASKRIFWIQACPALLALGLIWFL
jgi:putative membrane protein